MSDAKIEALGRLIATGISIAIWAALYHAVSFQAWCACVAWAALHELALIRDTIHRRR